MNVSDLKHLLDGHPSALKLFHINAESLPAHFDDFKELFNNVLKPDIVVHAPVRTAQFKHKPEPWINEEILRLDENVLRNRVKSLCRNAKLRFYHRQFNQSNSASTLWDNVRKLGAHPGKSKASINVPLDDLNNFFTSNSTQSASNSTNVPISMPVLQFGHVPPENHFYFSYVLPSTISHFQSGFRPNFSTSTALVRITDDLRLAMDKRAVTVLVQFDFSKAFDKVSHLLLLHKLKHQCHFSNSVVAWFSSYLSGRFQAVFDESGNMSAWSPVLQGVPRGSVLGPLLFSIFINNAPLVFQDCSYHLFADDLIIYSHTSVENIANCIENMNSNVSSLLHWATAHELVLNHTKTKSSVFGFSRLLNRIDLDTLPAIEIGDVQIVYSKCLKILGVVLDQTLSWKDQTTQVCNRVFAGMHQFKRLKNFLPKSIRILLLGSWGGEWLVRGGGDVAGVTLFSLEAERSDASSALDECRIALDVLSVKSGERKLPKGCQGWRGMEGVVRWEFADDVDLAACGTLTVEERGLENDRREES
ncbi:hypothetical protein LSTR_LSTR007832 [Laodelphax striatellus]|uniref:Reverse transcriptase domain-containing protein n=1 Tax=Laodelphax striatellus TaxID=195883 RepID=A0A482WP29_LAOST|nr:hypothetical protein LSTR_LSTR007832 [Laodelphax striatellus]